MTVKRVFFATSLAVALTASGAVAQSQPPEGGMKLGADPKIGHIKESPALDHLFESVDQLRKASVLLMDKQPGPEREKAFQAAQNATMLVQHAMAQLPTEMYSTAVKQRAAKDWPVVMARLDEATQELQSAIKAIQKDSGGGEQRSAAVENAQRALDKARQAMAALPAWMPAEKPAAK